MPVLQAQTRLRNKYHWCYYNAIAASAVVATNDNNYYDNNDNDVDSYAGLCAVTKIAFQRVGLFIELMIFTFAADEVTATLRFHSVSCI